MCKNEIQRVVIRNHLLTGRGITAIEAIFDFGILRLSAIILNIKKKDKIPIDSNMTYKYKNGRLVRFANYKIPPFQLQKLREQFCVD